MLGSCPSTFEVTAARVTISTEFYTVVVIYGPGSEAVTTKFYDELADLFDRVITTNDALFIVVYRTDDVLCMLVVYGDYWNATILTFVTMTQLMIVVVNWM